MCHNASHEGSSSRTQTAEVLQRQHQVFELRISGASLGSIGRSLGTQSSTVLSDLEAEQARRIRVVGGGNMANHIALSVARYEAVVLRTTHRLAQMQERWNNGDKGALKSAFLEERVIIEAQKRIDAVLGLEKAVVNESKQPPSETSGAQAVLNVFFQLPPEQRLLILQRVRERREAQRATET